MGFAKAVNIPALLVADIHRGGVIASIVGTLEVIDASDKARLKGFIINKFHGDVKLFENGKTYLEEMTKLPCLGIIPHFSNAKNLPAEDAVALEDTLASHSGNYKIVVLRLPRIANFDDLDPLRLEPGLSVAFLELGEPFPAIQIWSSSRVQNQPWPISLHCSPRAGISISKLMSGGVVACSASAEAIKC